MPFTGPGLGAVALVLITTKYLFGAGIAAVNDPDIELVVIELKNAVDENTTIHSAFRQVETYKAIIPSLFAFNGFVVISDGLEAKAGTISSGLSRFMSWKSADGKAEASHLVSQLETLILGMLNKETLIDLIRHFIVFEKSKKDLSIFYY